MIEKTFIAQGKRKLELQSYLKKEIERAGFTKLELVKTPLVTRIVLHVTNPGLAIGKGGQNIKTLTQTIEKRFGISNPQIEIKEIAIPALDAQAQADKIKSLIERGQNWRSIAYRVVREITEAKAQGVELVLSGKLAGKGGRKRKVRIAEGYMKKVGDMVRLVEFGKASAYPKAGAIGIKVRIVRPETIFPDKLKIEDLIPVLSEDEISAKEDATKKEISEKNETVKEDSKPAEKKSKPEPKEVKSTKEKKSKKELNNKSAEKKDLKKESVKETPNKDVLKNVQETKEKKQGGVTNE